MTLEGAKRVLRLFGQDPADWVITAVADPAPVWSYEPPAEAWRDEGVPGPSGPVGDPGPKGEPGDRFYPFDSFTDWAAGDEADTPHVVQD